MSFDFLFFLNSFLFGVGLAMDAFTVSIANALKDNKMKMAMMCRIASTFAVFQIVMPLIGWLCVHTIRERFIGFQVFIPWIALAILLFLGTKMIIDSVAKGREADGSMDGPDSKSNLPASLDFGTLMLQGVATSIDALSVGFTISEYTWIFALVEALIIGVVTFAICMAGLVIGKTAGRMFKRSAGIAGGIILILIGIEIFIKGMFFR